MANSTNPTSLIITCGCSDTDSFVKDAFPLLNKGELPPIHHTPDQLTNPVHIQMVKALDQAKQKYAYYFSDTEVWDIIKGVRIA